MGSDIKRYAVLSGGVEEDGSLSTCVNSDSGVLCVPYGGFVRYEDHLEAMLAATPPTDCRVDDAMVLRARQAILHDPRYAGGGLTYDAMHAALTAALSTRLAPVDGLTEGELAALKRLELGWNVDYGNDIQAVCAAVRRLAAAQVQDNKEIES